MHRHLHFRKTQTSAVGDGNSIHCRVFYYVLIASCMQKPVESRILVIVIVNVRYVLPEDGSLAVTWPIHNKNIPSIIRWRWCRRQWELINVELMSPNWQLTIEISVRFRFDALTTFVVAHLLTAGPIIATAIIWLRSLALLLQLERKSTETVSVVCSEGWR